MSLKEFLQDEEKVREVARAAFDSVDTDKSGLIDEEELTKVMTQISLDMETEPPSKEDVKKVLDHLDADHSGKIDCDEFKILIREVLSALIDV